MSTFCGITKEYRRVSIDRFDGVNLESTLYILSHFHSDHTVGLASALFKERLQLNPKIKLYCTDVTKRLILLEDAFQFLEEFMVPLNVNVPYQLEVPAAEISEQITLTLLPAGHCPGSAMCLIEGAQGRVLYTGDYRISASNLKLSHPLFDSEGHPKELESLYVDTTFFHPVNTFIPSRSYSLLCAIEVIGHWISLGPSKIVSLKFKASLGCEHLLTAISRHFNMKIHVSSFKFKQCLSIGDVGDLFTTDSESTQIHACDLVKPAINGVKQRKSSKEFCHCKVIKDTAVNDLRTVTFSAMYFTQAVSPDRYCMPFGRNNFRVCYSLHPSYTEVCRLVETLKPTRAFANVHKLGSKTPEDYDVQQALDEVVERAKEGRGVEDVHSGKEVENGLKRQFSENSMDNNIFDETQSYLNSILKRPRLDDHDVSDDIMDVDGHQDPSGGTKRKFSLIFGSDEESQRSCDDDDALPRVKRIAVDRKVLQQHVGNSGEEMHATSTPDLSNDDRAEDDYNTEEENKLLEITASDLVQESDLEDQRCSNDDAILEKSPPAAGCDVLPAASLAAGDEAENSCQYSNSFSSSVGHKDSKELTINLCDDGADDDTEEESPVAIQESDIAIELNSSFECVRSPRMHGAADAPRTFRSHVPRIIRVSHVSPDDEPKSQEARLSNPAAATPYDRSDESLQVVAQGSRGTSENAINRNSGVLCIDLTEEVEDDDLCLEADDDPDDDEEEEEEEEDEEEDGVCIIPFESNRFRVEKGSEDDNDDGGYEGGDEWESQECRGREENGATPKDRHIKVPEAVRDDEDDRKSCDSDSPHSNELHRKSHARFEKLYKRKQRKMKMDARRQNLRSVDKDDVIVIDDSSDSDDSYDYDSDDSSSDYDRPGKGRNHRNQRSDNDRQFPMPSLTSSSESSLTLSSEDNVVVLVNATKNIEQQVDRDPVDPGFDRPEALPPPDQ